MIVKISLSKTKHDQAANASARRAQLDQIVEQFQATLFHYDEGLMMGDQALAGALWCHLFSKDCNDPERIECIIHYIRKQVLYILPRLHGIYL